MERTNNINRYTFKIVFALAMLFFVTNCKSTKSIVASGEASDATIGSSGTTDDAIDSTSASVSYAVASGVTAILGYTSVEASDEGASSTDGSAWYIGANMAF